MKTTFLLALALTFIVASAQSQIIINKYAAVLAHPPCGNVFNVDDATGFNAGDTILVIQMKGAVIDSSNSAAFGTVLNYNGAGNYEFNVIHSVAGNAITLLYTLNRQYDIPAGRVQFVRVPYFQDYTIAQPHSCLPWNGSKGGIVVLNAAGTLTLNAGIDVSSKGFRNGTLVYSATAPCGKMDYYYPGIPNSDGAEKGEGITELSASRSNGRGAQANGGGGGNSHNGGGGGGGNGGAGGHGGKETAVAMCAPAQSTGGIGGIALSYSNTLNKVFMGGGAGAPHANNNASGTSGPGGGIVLLLANQLVGNSQSIVADGADGIGCVGDCWDGQFGGSAGGSVLLHVSSFSGNLVVSAKGGKGASQGANNTASGANGPGGGGGGGVLWVSSSSTPPQISSILTGGSKGVFINNNDPWGTTDGSTGINLTGLTIGFPTDTFKSSAGQVDFSYKIVSCNTTQFTALPAGAFYTSYLWNFGGGATSTLASPTYTFPSSGTYSVTLTVKDANGCTLTVTKQVTITPYSGSRKDTSLCSGQSVQLSTYPDALSYSWTPPTGLSSTTIYNPIASPSSTTMYVVTVDAGQGCVFQDTIVVHVSPAVKANFDFKPRPPIPNTPIQFYNLSTGASAYAWSFGDGMGSSEKDPSHLYLKTGSYRVCLVASNEGCLDSVCRMVDAEVHLVIAVPSAFSPNGDGANDVLFARGGGVQSFTLKIFNRWGQMVFETEDLAKGWDGTFKGQPQEVETYAYVLTATFIDGSTYQKSGNISLVR